MIIIYVINDYNIYKAYCICIINTILCLQITLTIVRGVR